MVLFLCNYIGGTLNNLSEFVTYSVEEGTGLVITGTIGIFEQFYVKRITKSI